MDVSFDQTTPVLFFTPNSYPLDELKKRSEEADELELPAKKAKQEKAAEAKQQFFFLWPAFSRQVLVHRGLTRKFNLFQSHVFRLCQAGIRSEEKIANLLMHPDEKEGNVYAVQLAKRVFGELVSLGVVSASGEPTESGLAQIEEDSAQLSEPGVITIFQDPWSGKVWNRVSEKPPLPIIEPKSYGQEFFRVQVGSTGKSRIENAFVVRPTGVSDCIVPAADSVFSAYRQFCDEARSLAMKKGKDPDEQDVSTEITSISSFGAIEPVFLVSYAVCLGRAFEGESWDVADPFGFGVSRNFLKQVRDVMAMPSMSRFAQRLRQTLPAEPLMSQSAPGRLWNKAEAMVKADFPRTFTEQAGLFEQSVNLQMSLSQVRPDSKEGDQDWHKPVFNILRESVMLIQSVLDSIKENHSTNGCYWSEGFSESARAKNAQKMCSVADKLGFTITAGSDVASQLFHISLREIIAAADFPRSAESLGAQLSVSLLSASHDSNGTHPLGRAAASHPLLIEDVARLYSLSKNISLVNIADELAPKAGEEIKQIAFRLVKVLLYPDLSTSTSEQSKSERRQN